MKILVISNHGQYNHRIYGSLYYLKFPAEIVPNTTSIEEINEKEPLGIILGGGPSIERAGNSPQYIKRDLDLPILGICLGHQHSPGLWWRNRKRRNRKLRQKHHHHPG